MNMTGNSSLSGVIAIKIFKVVYLVCLGCVMIYVNIIVQTSCLSTLSRSTMLLSIGTFTHRSGTLDRSAPTLDQLASSYDQSCTLS